MDVTQSIDVLRTEVEDLVSMTDSLQNQTESKIDELEALKECFDNIGATSQNYLETIENLQDTLYEFNNARDEARNYEIVV